ncbi:hypothetical protein PCE1_000200 [Barthelona sp. PCE]
MRRAPRMQPNEVKLSSTQTIQSIVSNPHITKLDLGPHALEDVRDIASLCYLPHLTELDFVAGTEFVEKYIIFMFPTIKVINGREIDDEERTFIRINIHRFHVKYPLSFHSLCKYLASADRSVDSSRISSTLSEQLTRVKNPKFLVRTSVSSPKFEQKIPVIPYQDTNINRDLERDLLLEDLEGPNRKPSRMAPKIEKPTPKTVIPEIKIVNERPKEYFYPKRTDSELEEKRRAAVYTNDGSVTVYYPTGETAITVSRLDGLYSLVFAYSPRGDVLIALNDEGYGQVLDHNGKLLLTVSEETVMACTSVLPSSLISEEERLDKTEIITGGLLKLRVSPDILLEFDVETRRAAIVYDRHIRLLLKNTESLNPDQYLVSPDISRIQTTPKAKHSRKIVTQEMKELRTMQSRLSTLLTKIENETNVFASKL